MKIIRTENQGLSQFISLTQSQQIRGAEIAKRYNIINDDGKHTWRAAVRALLSGKVKLEPPVETAELQPRSSDP